MLGCGRFDGPMYNGSVISKGFENPRGVVHATSGSGGPPGYVPCHGLSYRSCFGMPYPYSYTRMTVENASTLVWEQLANNDSRVIDRWVVRQDRHGPFPIPKQGA